MLSVKTCAVERSVGVFDSGIGGLSVLKALRAELPGEDFIYIADSGHAPYGERDDAHVIARSHSIAAHLVQQNIKLLVVACNTATAAAVHSLRANLPLLPIIGVEPALKPAVALSKTGHIAVLATRSTLASKKFQALMATQQSVARFTLVPCDGLAHAIERCAQTRNTTEITALCSHAVASAGVFGNQDGAIDTLVMGCTHYPFVAAYLSVLVGKNVQLLDNGQAVARQTRRQLETIGMLLVRGKPASTGVVSLFSTGQTQTLQAAAQHWLGLDTPVGLLYF